INDYWLLRIIEQMPLPPFFNWPLEIYRVRIALYRIRKTMFMPFGITSDMALPVAKGAVLIEAEETPRKLVTNPIYVNDSPREYVVKYAASGSLFRFDTPDGTVPSGPWMTFEEASAFALHWCHEADTIGGDALVYHVQSGL